MNTLPRRLAAGVAALALAAGVTACGDEATSVDATGPEGSWVFVAGTVDGAAIEPPVGPVVTLEVTGLNAAGQSACNGYGATLRAASDGDFEVAELSQTEIACDGPVNRFEQAYLGGFARVEQYAIDGGNLVLSGERVELRYESAGDVPAAALIGSEWVLDTLYDGDTASVPIVPEPGRINLRADGVFSGFDGCQLFLGEWSPAVGTEPLSTGAAGTLVPGSLPDARPVATPVHVVSFGVADPAAPCPGGTGEMAEQVREVLGGDFTAVVRGLELRLVNSAGLGLGYHTTADGSVPAPPITVPPLPPASGSTTTVASPPTTTTVPPPPPAATAAPPGAAPTPPPEEPPPDTTTTLAPTTTVAAATTVAPITTTPAPTESAATPPPSVPPVTDDPPSGALAAGTYWATLQSLSATTATFELGKAYTGQACRDRFADEPARCDDDWELEPGLAVAATVDLAVATITVSDPSRASYRVSVGELGRLTAGEPPAAGAPAGFGYTPYAYLLTVRSGLVIAAEQVFTA